MLRCVQCIAGTWSSLPAATACIHCQAGTWNNRTGSNSIRHCVNCPAGTYSTRQQAMCVSAVRLVLLPLKAPQATRCVPLACGVPLKADPLCLSVSSQLQECIRT
eukprot:TRINITY_DN9385_c0_g1_i1.p2 TRINITY_DN9385_c0_g1~~TRINITY_DN9385_c0_g1_i1.p2  ORF type:complete len:105 (-),score=14.79 TRINITY_DN9385_c0_g1_i1:49-363(-)